MEGESRWMGQECHFFPLMVMLWICRTRVVLRRKKEGTECVVLLVCRMCQCLSGILPVHVIFHFSIHGICTFYVCQKLTNSILLLYSCSCTHSSLQPPLCHSPLPNPLFSTLHSPLSTPLSHSLSLLSLFSLSPSPSSSPSSPSSHSSLSSSHYQVVNFFVQFSKI